MNNNAKLTLNFSQNIQQNLPAILPSLTDVLQKHNIQEESRDFDKIILHLNQNSKQDQDEILNALTEIFNKHNIQEEEAIVAEFIPTEPTLSSFQATFSTFGVQRCVWKCIEGTCGWVCD